MLAGETRSAYQALTAEGGVLEKLQDAQVSIDKIAGVDGTVETQQKAVREAYFLLEDVGHELARYQASIDFSEDELEVRQTRFQRFKVSCADMVQRWMRSSQPSLKRTSSLLLMIRATNCSRKRNRRARKLKIGLFRRLMRSRLLAKRWRRAFLLRSPLRWLVLRWGALLWCLW